MFTPNIQVSNTIDKMKQLKEALIKLKNIDVMVGIPQANDSRNNSGESQISNAELAFVHTNGVRAVSMRKEMESNVQQHGYHKAHEMYIQAKGSPLWQSPPRPIIEPAIEADKEVITELLKEAMAATLEGNQELAQVKLNAAGLEGQAASQDWFTNPKNGWAPNSEDTVKRKGSDKPLIDTGELRKAITYVVRKKG